MGGGRREFKAQTGVIDFLFPVILEIISLGKVQMERLQNYLRDNLVG